MISVTANIVPGKVHYLVELASKGKIDKAKELHLELLELNQAMFIETNPIPVKGALAMMGRIVNELRLPLVPLSEKAAPLVRKALQDFGIDLS